MRLTNANAGIPPYAYGIAALVVIAGVGVAILRMIRTARDLADCCPHPDLDDFSEEAAA